MKTYYDDGTVKIRSMVAEDAKVLYDTYLSYGLHPQTETYENYYKEQEAGARLVFIAEYEGAVKGQCTLVLHPTEGPWGGQDIPDGSGVWYQNKNLDRYAPCVNDDDLLLFLSKDLK